MSGNVSIRVFFNVGLRIHADYSLVFSIVSIDIHKSSDMLGSDMKTSNNYGIICLQATPPKSSKHAGHQFL